MTNLSTIKVCPQSVFTVECPGSHLNWLVRFSEQLKDDSLIRRGGASSPGFFYPISDQDRESSECSQLHHWLHQCVNQVRDRIIWSRSEFPGLRITQSWINISRKLMSHDIHDHPMSILSGVICLSDQVEIDLYIKSSYSLPLFLCVDKGEADLLIKQTIELSKGDLILFPSSLRHGVAPHQGDVDRMTFAFNSFFAGTIGCAENLASLRLD